MSTGAAPASTGGAPASTGGAPASTGAAASTGGSTAAGFMGWGDGWRAQMSKASTDPEKELKQLERYESPEAIWRKARELERKMSAGELKSTLRKDATAQEVAAWRAENGIPAKADDYKINAPAGRPVPKEDDGFLAAFRKSAHESHFTQAQLDVAVQTFYAEVDRQEGRITEAEKKAEAACEDKLRLEWQADYKPNKAMAEALLARAPAGFRDRFMNGYLADHTPIRATPDAWKWLVQMEREINPFATVVPGGGTGSAVTVQARIDELKKMMGNQASDYWKGPKAEALQEEYRKLVSAQQRAAGQSG